MPIISQFYGIVITMYYNVTNGKHHIPHIHARYNNDKIVYDFNANIIEGKIPLKQKRMVEASIEDNYNIKITKYNKEMYKQGFIDGVNLIINYLTNKQK